MNDRIVEHLRISFIIFFVLCILPTNTEIDVTIDFEQVTRIKGKYLSRIVHFPIFAHISHRSVCVIRQFYRGHLIFHSEPRVWRKKYVYLWTGVMWPIFISYRFIRAQNFVADNICIYMHELINLSIYDAYKCVPPVNLINHIIYIYWIYQRINYWFYFQRICYLSHVWIRCDNKQFSCQQIESGRFDSSQLHISRCARCADTGAKESIWHTIFGGDTETRSLCSHR